ncbi:DUF4595 domain-containing protein [uncultured Bacteroides sp.]|uniref:DUF4595 domain-containing protein n=1 Tax=uncultured Bacteroides sp. TaxID=162156 RepID=UPI0025E8215A|nr:DUF4595 domain-containing protein [uncultured Bacteroides sp.]
MKTFRLIGMALLAVMMCVNFVSCGDDDEEPIKNEDGIVTNEKKLVQIIRNGDRADDIWDFFYDSKGRLSKVIYNIYNETNIDEYIWGDNTIIVPNSHTGTLSNNLMRNIVFHKYEYITKYEYNSSKQLTKVQSADLGEYTITWENGKIVKINDNYEFTYSGKTCKGYNPLFIEKCGIDEEDLFYAHPELAGCRCTQLPDKQTYKREATEYETMEYTYKFDNDGYLLSCHEKGDYDQCIYFFKWE